MADEDLDLDVQKSGKGTKLLLIGLIVLVLILAGVGGFFFFASGGEDEEEGATAESEAAVEEMPKETLYMRLGNPFTINFSENRKANFLQIEITIMARKQAVLDIVKKHKPIIQDDVINIISSKTFDDLNNEVGKKQLAEEILKSIQSVVEAELKEPGVEAVYFTSFIMQ